MRDFLAFLTASKNADRPRVKVIIKMPGMSFQGEEVMSSGLLRFFRATRDLRMVRMLGLGVVTMKTGEVVAAPPGSLEFEDRFQRDVAAIREGIRDVTLGADRPRVD